MPYWEDRNLERMLNVEKMSETNIRNLLVLYANSLKNINRDIIKTFEKYVKDGNITKSEALKLLNKREKDAFYKSLIEKINTIQDKELKRQLLTKYNAPAYAARISRLEALKDNLNITIKQMADTENILDTKEFGKLINYAYNSTIFDVTKDIGFSFSFSNINQRLINVLLSEKWVNNRNYSDRIWKNADLLSETLQKTLYSGLMTGKNLKKISNELAEKMEVGKFVATRLVRTEANYFANQAEALAYEECGVETYIYLATLDVRTCEKCGKLDLKEFKLADKKEGINFPPLHAFDRCTTVPKVNMENIKTRIARDSSGKNIKVPVDIDYKKWYNEYVENNPEGQVLLKKYQNRSYDRKQFEEYKSIINDKKFPKTLVEFQNLKYGDIQEWKLTKYNYKLLLNVKNNPSLILEDVKNIEIDENKYTNYLFTGKGIDKGKAITSRLGYGLDNYKELDSLVKKNINKYPTIKKEMTEYGQKYETNIVVRGITNKQAKLKVGLMKDKNRIWLTSLYIDKLKESDLKHDL